MASRHRLARFVRLVSTPLTAADMHCAGKVGKASAEETYTSKIIPLLAKYPDVFTPDPSATHRKIAHYSIDDFHVQGSRMLSRSFSVPKGDADLDMIGDVSMTSGADRAEEMPDVEDAVEADEAGGDDDDESEDEEDEDADSEPEPEEEEVMVPVADILNAAFGLDNVSLAILSRMTDC